MRTPAPKGATGNAREATRAAGSSRARGLVLPFLLLLGGMLLAGVMFAGAAPNNPPTVVSSGGTLAYTEDDGAVTFDGGFLVDDLDGDPIQGATVQISGGFVSGEDELASGGGGGVGASWDSGTGVLTLSGAAPASTYQIVLRQITYENLSQSPSTGIRTVSVTVTDGFDPSGTTTRDIAVTSVHDDPQLTVTSGSLAYTESTGAVPIDVGATVVDAEDDLVGATLQITGGYVPAEDTLGFAGLGAITGAWDGGTGTLTLSGTGPTSDWQDALRAVTYTNSSNNPTTAPRTVSVTVTDGTATDGPSTRVIAITSVNDAPSPGGDVTAVAPGGGALSVPEDTPTPGSANVRVVPTTLADVEGPVPTAIRITSVTGGTLLQSDGSALGLGSGGSILTLSGGGVDLRFTPTANRDTNASLTYIVVDAANPGVNSTASTATIPIAPVNDAPTLTASGGSAAFVENGGPVVVDAGITLADIDSANLASATVQITGGYEPGVDVLAATGGGGISTSWNSGTGTLTLTGSASLAAYQSALRAVTFDNPSENPAVSARTVSFTVNDGTDPSPAGTRGLTVTPANDAPVVTAGGGATYTENDPAVAIDTGVTVGDVDSATITGATVQISGGFVAGEDVLGGGGGGRISTSWNTGTGTLTLTGSASLAAYQSALAAVSYTNTSDAPDTGARTVTYAVTDGTDPSAGSTATVTVVAINDSPSLTGGGGTVAYTENDTPLVVDPDVTIADLDDTDLEGAVVRIGTNLSNSEDVLGFTNQNGISGSWAPLTGTLTLSGTATLAEYEAALESVTYTNVSDDPSTATRTIEMEIDDGDDQSGLITDDVTITAVNDAPTVALDTDPIAFVENDPTTPIDAAVTVTDLDDATIERVDLTTNGWHDDEDDLVVTPSGGITATYDPTTGTVHLVGPASPNAFSTVLQSIRFHNPEEAPTAGTRTFTLVADDGVDAGPSVARDLILTPVNDPPVALNDSAEILQGSWIAVDVLGNDTDVDGSYLRIKSWDPVAHATVSTSGGLLKVVPDDDFVGVLDVHYDVSDGRLGLDTARLRVRVRAAADGSVTLGDLPNPVTAKSPLTEVVKVRNWGPGTLEDAVVSIRVPGSELRRAEGPDGVTCRASDETFRCPLGDLDPGARVEIVVTAIPRAAGLLTATATLDHDSIDPDDADLADSETTTVLARPGTVPVPGDDDDDDGGGGWPPVTTPPTSPPATTPPTTTTVPSTTTSTTVAPTTTTFDDTIDDVEEEPEPTTTTETEPEPLPTAPAPTLPPTTAGGGGSQGSPFDSVLVLGLFVAAAAVFLWQRQRQTVR